ENGIHHRKARSAFRGSAPLALACCRVASAQKYPIVGIYRHITTNYISGFLKDHTVMKKMKLSLLPIAVIILAFGCTKDPVAPPKEEPREPTEIIEDIVGNLATADSISVFVDKLKELPLSAAD